jgi:hypothetical protein
MLICATVSIFQACLPQLTIMVDANLWNERTAQPFTTFVRSNLLFSRNFLLTTKKY